MVTIGVDQSLTNSAMYEHIRFSGKYYDQQQYKDII